MTHDVEIIDTLDLLSTCPFSGELWRTTWVNRNPLLGSADGGRWSPNRQFEALYTSLEKHTSIHELHHHLSLAPVFSSATVLIHRISARDLNLLDLTAEQVLKDLRIHREPSSQTLERCQKIGAAAHFLDAQGILVPSYRTKGTNCVLFRERIHPEQLHAESSEDINWPAWIKQHLSRGRGGK